MSLVSDGLQGIDILASQSDNPLELQRIIALQINQASALAEAGSSHPWESLPEFLDFVHDVGKVLTAIEAGNYSGASIIAKAALQKIH